MAELPSADEFFGAPARPAPSALPTADEFFAPKQQGPSTNAIALGGADMDEYFSQGSAGKILDVFGQGAKDGWGATPLGMTPDADKWLKQHAPDYGLVGRAFHDEIVRPAAAALDFAMNRLPNAIYHGAGDLAVMAGVPRDIVALPEAFPAGHLTGFPSRIIPPELERASDLGVIGKGEAGYKGLSDANTEAVRALSPTGTPRPNEIVTARAEAPAREPFATPEEAAPAGPDLHAAARQIAPETFTEFDALSQQRDALRSTIGDLADMRDRGTSPSIDALDQQIADLRGRRLEAPGAERRAMADQITALEGERAKLADALPKTGDTSDMAAIRQQMMDAQYRMRDLAPDVTVAYRRAAEGAEPTNEPLAAPVAEAPPEAAVTAPQADEAPPVAAPIAEASPALPEPSATPIAQDVSRQLVSAGRPAEEANAAGALVQAHYEARAARFNGAKGTADDLYSGDAPSVRAGRGARQSQPDDAMQVAQSRRGKIRLATDDAKATITLFKDADASTFVHETGHAWLEELARDAADPAAPSDLKTDMGAVHQWLGTNPDASIPTRAHEKFARGFERYMMEGHAPSEALAGVFAKFRDWLTAIYQTVARLRSPINDDIRGVFDRLLATKGEKPVIAPGEPTGTFADLHEIDAATTPPEQAGEVAGVVRDERDKVMEAAHPEVDDERLGARASEIDGRSATGGDVSGARVAALEPDTATTGGVSRRSPIGPRGNEAAANGNRPPVGRSTEPAGPSDTFGRTDERLIDKAGNIRVDNLNIPEDVASAIRDAAEANGGFLAARRGVLSDGEVLSLADALGMDPSKLNQRQLGEAFNAEQVIAARKLLIQSATDVRDAMARAASGSDADVVAYGTAKARHLMIQEQVSGLTAEAGRALRAFRAIEGSKDATELSQFLQQQTGRTLNQMRQEAQLGMKLDTPQKVSKFVQDTEKPTWKDYVMEAWINALLSGPLTHIKNIIGNTAVAINSVIESGGAAAVGAVRQILPGTAAERVRFGEAQARLFGLAQGAQDGLIAAGRALLDENVLSEGPHTIEQRRHQAIPSVKVNVAGIDMQLGGATIRLPGRFLTAEDELFKAIAFRQEMNALAYRRAAEEGLSGDPLAGRIAQILQYPDDALIDAAKKHALYQTFQNSLGRTGIAIQQFANSHILAKIVVPFVRTPINILKYARDRTPIGLASREVRDNLMGKNGAIARDTQVARMALGSMVATTAATLAYQGLITGGGPSDPKERAAWLAAGNQPYSIKIGNMSYSYGWLDPIGTIMGTAADMVEITKAGIANHAEMDKLAAMFVGSLSKNIMQKASLRGASDLVQTLTDPDRYGPRYLQNLAGSLVPSVLGQIARADDPLMRDARTVVDVLKSRIPGLRMSLFPRRDIWGEPIPNEGALGPDLLSPILQRAASNDPVKRMLVDLPYSPAQPDRKIRGVELTPQQYDDYSRISGRMAKMELDAIVNPGFRQLPPDTQIHIISSTVSHAREGAAAQIMMQSFGGPNDIIKKASEAKASALHGASRAEVKASLRAN